MPIQIFPPPPPKSSSRETSGDPSGAGAGNANGKGKVHEVSSIRRLIGGFVGLLLLAVAMVCATPLFLLNTSTGRTILKGAANSTDEGHLGLGNAQLSIFPSISLLLEDLRLTQPFEPLAPRMSMRSFLMDNLSRDSYLPGNPLVCEVARIEGVRLEVHQKWVQARQKDAKPPSLPDVFPSLLLTDVIEISDTDYTVHQTRNGRAVDMKLSGIQATLRNFEWDLKAMKVKGEGPLTARSLNLNGMPFENLRIPVFRANGNRLEMPSGVLTGLGGTVSFSGAITLDEGIPMPDFHIKASRLELTQVIKAAPDPAPPGPTPNALLSLEARVTVRPPESPGEVAEPILEGDVVMEDFQVPLVKQDKMAMKVLERMPGYVPADGNVPGSVARLDLGTFRAHIRIDQGVVQLQNAQMSLGTTHLAMSGTIQQGSGALNLKLWLDRSSGGLSAPTPADPETSASGGTEPPTPVVAAEPAPASGASNAPAALVPAPATPIESPAQPVTLKERLLAKKAEIDANVLSKKAEIDAKMLETKEKVTADLEKVKQDVEAKVKDQKELIEGGPEAVKARLDARAAQLKSQVDATLAQVKGAIDARIDAALDRFEEKHGRPTLCITGTTAQPIMQVCSDASTQVASPRSAATQVDAAKERLLQKRITPTP